MKKLAYLVFAFLISFNCLAVTVLIDPGHGGEDEGASTWLKRYHRNKRKNTKIHEKELALTLSKKIHERLKKTNIKSFLTRSIDRTVSLQERAELAAKIKADLFISIHINSSTRKNPRGFETYYLDNHNDGAVNKVEQVENKGLKGEALIIHQILTDLVVDRTVKTSKALADRIHSNIHRKIGGRFKMVNRGTKPGMFYVLALAKRPAVLLEVGFMSNHKDLKRMLNPGFQDRYADAVVKGIVEYVQSKNKSQLALF